MAGWRREKLLYTEFRGARNLLLFSEGPEAEKKNALMR
jgi:hypothetical protein